MMNIIKRHPETGAFTSQKKDGTFTPAVSKPGVVLTNLSEQPEGPAILIQRQITGQNGFNVLK
jgi:hypothetical protein